MKDFTVAGMNREVESMDACHILLEKCSHRLNQNHYGGKSKNICRSFNLTANHRCQILHRTSGHPARWNNTAIVLMDDFATLRRTDKIMMDTVFKLYDYDDNGCISSVKYRGEWLMVDNDYLN